MSALNVPFDLANAANVVIPVDRWGIPRYTVQLESGTSVAVAGTLARVNRGETAVFNNLSGTKSVTTPGTVVALAALTPADGIATIVEQPLEAIRITATGACIGRVMQTGGGGL